jgi:hypothetical protein
MANFEGRGREKNGGIFFRGQIRADTNWEELKPGDTRLEVGIIRIRNLSDTEHTT